MPRGGQQGQVVQVAGAPAAAGAGTWEGKAGYTGCEGAEVDWDVGLRGFTALPDPAG